jgi:hypothetical protein
MNEELLTKLQQRAERATKIATQIRALDDAKTWQKLPWDLETEVFVVGKVELRKRFEAELCELLGEPEVPAARLPILVPCPAQLPNELVVPHAKYECKVCGNTPDDSGILEHGRGCYMVDEDGGGSEYIEEAAR